MRAFSERCGLEHLADRDQAGGFVRHLDPHRRFPWDGRLDAERRGRQRERQVILQGGDPLDLHSRTGLQLVLGHRRPWIDADDLARHAERLECDLDDLDVALDFVGHALATRRHRVEQRDRRQLPFDLGNVVLGFRDHAQHRFLGLFVGFSIVSLRRRRRVVLVLGFDLPRPERGGGDGRIGRSHRFGVRDRRDFDRGLGRVLARLTRGRDQSVEPPPLGVSGLSGVEDRGNQGTGAEVDGHDQPDDEGSHQQCPRSDLAGEPDHRGVDGTARSAARMRGEAEESDQGDHRDGARQNIEQPGPGRLRPEHVRAEGDGADDGHEPSRAEAGRQPLLQARQDRPSVRGDGECAEQADEDQNGAGYLPNLALRQVRPARPLRPRGTGARGGGAAGAVRA